MVTRRRHVSPFSRRLGTIRHADFRRNDDACLRSNPYLMAKLERAMRDIAEGRYFVGSLEEAEAWFKQRDR